jgi:WD40 repeat protein
VTESEALPELASGGRTIADLAATFRAHPEGFGLAIEGGLRQAAALLQRDRALPEMPSPRLALVVDQLEQLFTLEGLTTDDRGRFVACLASAVKARAAVVIATIRSDFFEQCHGVPGLLALMQGDGQFQLQSPGPAELERIITRPAALAGLDFEPGTETRLSLDQRLRDAALDHEHSLPLLEFALEQLYERRTPEGRLTHAAYDEIGELRGAVANHAEQAFLAWCASRSGSPSRPGPETNADAALGMLLRTLVTIQTANEQITARRFPEGELPPGPARDLAAALLTARLLVKESDHAGRPVFAVAHEAVLREWPRARAWLARDLEFLRIRSRITADQVRWESSSPSSVEHRDPGFLLPSEGRRLAEAEDLLRKHRADLEPATIEYINASIRRAAATTRWRRSGYAALLVLLLGTAFGVYAVVQSREIDQQRRLAVAYRLASQAELTRPQRPGLSALLAAESLIRQPGLEADAALRRSLAILPELVSEQEIGQVTAVSPAPGRHVVEYRQGQGLRTFNPLTNARSPWLLGAMAGDLALSATYVTPDGARVVNLTQSPASKNHIRVVQTATGAVSSLEVPGYFARTALSPDGRWLAAVADSRILTWDLTASPPRAYGRPMAWKGSPGQVHFSTDAGRLAVTAGFNVYVFDGMLGEPRVISRSGSVNSVAFRPHGGEIAIAGSQDVCLWTLTRPDTPACMPQDQPTSQIAFDASGSRLAVAGESGVLRVVDVATRAQTARFAHDDKVSSVVWNAAGTMLAATTADKIVHVWNTVAQREVARLSDEARILWFDGALTTISNASRIRRWSLHEGLIEDRLLPHVASVHDVTFAPDGKSIITGAGYDGDEETDQPDYNARVWSIDPEVEAIVLPQRQAVGAVRLAQNGRYLVTAGWWHIGVWDLQQPLLVATIPCKSEADDLELAQLGFALSRDGRLLACHTGSGSIQVFAVSDGRRIGPEATGSGPVLGVALSDDGSLLAMGGEQTLEIREVAQGGEPVRVPMEGAGYPLGFIPGSNRLMVASESGARIFDLKRRAWEALGMSGPITVLPRVGADGRFIVLVNEATASIRDLTSGQEVVGLVHPARINDVALSGDNRLLATAAADGVARVWDVATRREQVRLTDISSMAGGPLSRVALSADGKFLATAHGRNVRVWLVNAEDLRAQACGRVRGNLTAPEWADYVGAGDACRATCPAFPACAGVAAEGSAPSRLLK